MCKSLQENGKSILKLAPTNKSARIIEGQTLDKYCYKILQSKNGLNKAKTYDYVFIDEVSMVRETFYKVMIMIKNTNLNMKFIISGDFFNLVLLMLLYKTEVIKTQGYYMNWLMG
jgi:superfamily I DNA and RNA helicase